MRAQMQQQSMMAAPATPGAAVRAPVRCVAVRITRRSSSCFGRRCPGMVHAAASSASASPSQPVYEPEAGPRAFPYPIPMNPNQGMLASIPLPVFVPGIVAGIGALAYGVSILAKQLPVDPTLKGVVSVVAAALAAAAAAAGAAQLKRTRDSASIVDLYNLLVELPEPAQLTFADVKAIGTKYGISMQKDEPEGLSKIYGQMLENIIPQGENQLRGDEAEKVKAFKQALGLTDEEAAPIHMEVGRRLNRTGYETKDRQAQFETRKAFQRLMYVSQVVFGDQKAAFLLPWRRTFNLTDAQLFVARRDNANVIFKAYLDSQGSEIAADRHFLHELRKKQVAVKMLDEWASDVVKEYTRKHVEKRLDKAIELLRATGKNKSVSGAITNLRQALEYNRKMVAYSSEDDLVPGLGQITLAGGPWAAELKQRDVKELFKVYVDEELARLGEFNSELDRDVKELQTLLGLRAREAQMLQDEVAAKVYRKLLREAVSSKRLENAPSPAVVLQELCHKVRFSAEGASEFHKIQYKVKAAALMEKGKLSDEDVKDLMKIRRMLCIPDEVANKVMRDTAGKALEEVLADIFMMGPKPVLDLELQRVDSIMHEMRLDSVVAVEVLSQVARERFFSYVQAAQKAGDRSGVAAPLKKMVQFNALVVTPLLDRVRGVTAARTEPEASSSTASPTSEEAVAEARRKLQSRRGDFAEEEKHGQKEVNLRDLVVPEMRAELYKNFLMQSMSGESVDLPVGGTMRKKSNEAGRQADMIRLQQLADLLGMQQTEVLKVHQGLGEAAYKQQCLEALRAGPIGEQTVQFLDETRVQLGLAKEVADRLLKQARAEVYGPDAQTAEEGGRWSVDRLQAMAAKGEKADTLMEEPARRNMFRREVEQRLLDGSGDVDADFVLKTLPALLVLDPRKVKSTLKDLAATRKRRELVQAVSQLRQKRLSEVVTSLQNLLSCSKVLPDEPAMEWSEREEVKSVFGLYCAKEMNEAKQVKLQGILGLTDEEVADARAAAAAAAEASQGRNTEEDESFF